MNVAPLYSLRSVDGRSACSKSARSSSMNYEDAIEIKFDAAGTCASIRKAYVRIE